MQKIVNSCCIISVSKIRSIVFHTLAFDKEFKVKVNVCFAISWYQELNVCLVNRINGLVYCFDGLLNSYLSELTSKNNERGTHKGWYLSHG